MKYLFLTALTFFLFSCGHSGTFLSPKTEDPQKQQTSVITNINGTPISPDWKADFSFETDRKGEIVLLYK
ncbi:hypothetical protein GVN16_05255 [Emticicia sp. CRIBPO]|uniref:hypothetical protein n=1 Tax=Emticicia sp. CRIBPO TaxID=2683258 RepID=UPI001412DB44|nr:hypothetical protein [Emticicia sp. CRIBPO]NBA85156.1 hypothetical protein [Emticicia sp. CRIBPO]